MRWEALLWSLFALTAPAGAALLWRRINPRLPAWAEPLIPGAGWLHGLLLPYLALLSGSVPGGLVGLYAVDALEWFAGTLACLLGLLAVFVAHQRRGHAELKELSAVERWKDEPRWALYRATGALWIQDVSLGAGLGLILSILEWLLTGLSRNSKEFLVQDREPLYRSAVSTALFVLTQNFWLTAGTQLAFFVLLESWSKRKAPKGQMQT